MAGLAIPPGKRFVRDFLEQPRFLRYVRNVANRAAADPGDRFAVILQEPLGIRRMAFDTHRGVLVAEKVLDIGIMGRMTTHAITLLHVDMPFSRRSRNDIFMAGQTELLRPAQQQLAELRHMGAVARGAFPLFRGDMTVLARFDFALHVLVALVAQFARRRERHGDIIGRVRIMAGAAGLVLERPVHVLGVGGGEHPLVARDAELLGGILEKPFMVRNMGRMA